MNQFDYESASNSSEATAPQMKRTVLDLTGQVLYDIDLDDDFSTRATTHIAKKKRIIVLSDDEDDESIHPSIVEAILMQKDDGSMGSWQSIHHNPTENGSVQFSSDEDSQGEDINSEVLSNDTWMSNSLQAFIVNDDSTVTSEEATYSSDDEDEDSSNVESSEAVEEWSTSYVTSAESYVALSSTSETSFVIREY